MLLRKALRTIGRQEWLRWGVRDRLARFFHCPDTAKPEPFTVDFYGYRYRGDFSDYLDWTVFYLGAYSRQELQLFEELSTDSPDSVFLDIGANVGHHSLFASIHFGQVHSFEPFGPVAEMLKSKIGDNQVKNIHLHPYGLGDESGTFPYAPPTTTNRGTGSFFTADASEENLTLKVMQGDASMAAEGIGRIDFVKIDVEGFEAHVLRGLSENLKSHRPIIFFEWSLLERESADGVDIRTLIPENYTLYQFYHNNRRFIFFRTPKYHLEEISGQPGDGNILALPNEVAKQPEISQLIQARLVRPRFLWTASQQRM